MKKYINSAVSGLITILFFVSNVFSQSNSVKSKPVIIGYVAGFKGLIDTDKIAAQKLTHINYAFVNVKGNRAFLDNLKTDTVNFRKLNLLKGKNPDLKIFISIGGWAWSENFSDAVLTDSSRAEFAQSSVDIIKKYDLDGVDIDWEYPARPGEEGNVYRPEDKQNFTLMFQAIRKELDVLEKETGHKKLLSTAVGGFTDFLRTSEMGEAQKYLDYVNLMTYDLYTGGGTASHHANLYDSKKIESKSSADKTIKAFIAAGVPASKLVMGIAFYGRNFKIEEGGKKGLGDKVVSGQFGKGYTMLKDSLINKHGYKRFMDKGAKAPYLFNEKNKTFITYEDEQSVKNKCKYVKEHGLAGVMFWEYSSDPKEYLLDEINKRLANRL
nr:glycoside hydrolase family 18 protein [Pedobacter panaciterrae]